MRVWASEAGRRVEGSFVGSRSLVYSPQLQSIKRLSSARRGLLPSAVWAFAAPRGGLSVEDQDIEEYLLSNRMLVLALFHEGDILKYRQIEQQRRAQSGGEPREPASEEVLSEELRRKLQKRAGSVVIDDAEHVLMNLGDADGEGVSPIKGETGKREEEGKGAGESGGWGKPEKRSPSSKWEKLGKLEKSEKPLKRSQVHIHLEKPEKAGKPGKADEPGKLEKPEKPLKRYQVPSHSEKLEKPEKPEKLEKPEKQQKQQKPEKPSHCEDDFELFDVMSIYSVDEIARLRDRESRGEAGSAQAKRPSVGDPSKRTITLGGRQELRNLFAKDAQGDREYQNVLNSIAKVSGNADGVARLPEVQNTPENMKKLRDYLRTLNLSSEQIDKFLGEECTVSLEQTRR